MDGFEPEVVQLGDGITEKDLIVHDEHDPTPAYAFLLAHGRDARTSRRRSACCARSRLPVYEKQIADQLAAVATKKGKGDLAKLLRAGDTWEVQ